MKIKSYKINPKRLKYLREKSKEKLSQTDLALKAFGDGNKSKPDSLIRHYQRIEKTGETSLESAKKLASALGVNLKDLQNPEEQIDSLKEHIKRHIEALKLANDEAALALIAEALNWEKSDVINVDIVSKNNDRGFNKLLADAYNGEHAKVTTVVADSEKIAIFLGKDYGSMAKKMLESAEQYFLDDDQEKLRELAGAFGVSIDDLRPAAPIASYWWFSYPRLDNCLGSIITYDKLTWKLREFWESIGCAYTQNSKASLIRHDNKYRLAYQSEYDCEKYCEFWACDVSREDGIQWIKASEWELECLMGMIKHDLFDCSEQVIIDDKEYPPEDKDVVYKAYFKQFDYYEEFPNTLRSCTDLGSRIFDNDRDFDTSLKSLLNEYEADKWKFSNPSCYIVIEFYEDIKDNHRFYKRVVKRIEIRRGWLDEKNEFHIAPWSRAIRESMSEFHTKTWNGCILLPDEDFVIPRFEPETKAVTVYGDVQ